MERAEERNVERRKEAEEATMAYPSRIPFYIMHTSQLKLLTEVFYATCTEAGHATWHQSRGCPAAVAATVVRRHGRPALTCLPSISANFCMLSKHTHTKAVQIRDQTKGGESRTTRLLLQALQNLLCGIKIML